eukprot:TRINITY_DN20014_c0_g1_i2.p1 TRINITY_DN20014_c0_g1~~TRINITY_DN20014_c0_g1_i2.p1  ORF type:complete len:155 (+),score=21.10 TRINITY_DN20014_c0_g1_i2:178-642(+)
MDGIPRKRTGKENQGRKHSAVWNEHRDQEGRFSSKQTILEFDNDITKRKHPLAEDINSSRPMKKSKPGSYVQGRCPSGFGRYKEMLHLEPIQTDFSAFKIKGVILRNIHEVLSLLDDKFAMDHFAVDGVVYSRCQGISQEFLRLPLLYSRAQVL